MSSYDNNSPSYSDSSILLEETSTQLYFQPTDFGLKENQAIYCEADLPCSLCVSAWRKGRKKMLNIVTGINDKPNNAIYIVCHILFQDALNCHFYL